MDMPMEQLLRKYGGYLFLAYALGSLVPLLAYDTESNAPFVWAFKYLSVVITGLCFYAFIFKMPSYQLRVGAIRGSLFTLMVSALLVLMSGGYVILANALGPSQREILIQGRISSLSVSSGRRSKSYQVSIAEANGRHITFEITRTEYDQLAIGQPYSQYWKVGSLGILYK